MSSLAEMLFLQSQAQQSPVQRGAEAGIQAAQNSIAMSDMQRRRAEGQGIMQVVNHLYRPEYGHGLRGTLAGLNAGIQPGMNAYLGAEERARAENMQMLERQDKIRQQQEMMAMKQKQMEEMQRYHNASLALRAQKSQSSAYDLMSEQNVESMKESGALPKDAIYLGNAPKGVQQIYVKDLMSRINSGKAHQHVLKQLDEMQKLSDEFPNLDQSFNQIFVKGEEVTPDFLDILLRGAQSQKERSAIQKWAKLNNNLMASKIAGISGKVVTDVYKNALKQTLPQMGQTKEARDYVIKLLRGEHEPGLQDSITSRNALINNTYVPAKFQTETEEPKSTSSPPKQLNIHSSDFKNLSTEDLLRKKAELKQMMHGAP